jgi:hypothetical protein
MLMPDFADVLAMSALMLGLGILLDVVDWRRALRRLRDADRRSAFARRRWPQPLSKLDGELVGWAMNGAAAPLIRDLKTRRGWKRWFAR